MKTDERNKKHFNEKQKDQKFTSKKPTKLKKSDKINYNDDKYDYYVSGLDFSRDEHFEY